MTDVRRLGGGVIAGELRKRFVSDEVNVGLRCDLEHLPPLKEAKIPLTLERCDEEFDGYDAELARTTGADYGRVLRRKRLHERGVQSMHVAFDESHTPVYVQWLVTPESQAKLTDPQWPQLKPGEVMLEFAYTFTPFRGFGVMGDAMRRLLQVAADEGHRSAITYVRDDNIPSLRGCQKVGFDLDHVRATSHRAGITRHTFDPPTEDDRRRWAEATAARPKA